MDLSSIRAQIPALSACTYLNTAGIGPSPRAVTDTIVNLYRQVEAESPDLMAFHKEEFTQVESTRATVARHWRVDPDEVALLRSTAEGFNLIAHGLSWREGDEVISSIQDHPAARSIWTVLARRYGIVVRHLDLGRDLSSDEIVAAVKGLMTARTRLISVSHVMSENGLLVPGKQLADLAHAQGARLFLDGTQAVGQRRFDLREMGVDFYAGGFYKWGLGPFGTGALYVRRELLSEVEQALVGAGGSVSFDHRTGNWEPDPTARRFEFGARSYPLYPAMAAGISFVESAGMDAVQARSAALVEQLRSAVAKEPRIVDFTPTDPALRTGIVALAVEGVPGAELRDRLREQGFLLRANRGPGDVTGVRVCCAFFNSEAEIHRVGEAIRAIAR